MKIVLIVPTKDRPDDIKNLFESIAIQTRMPDEVIVVDGSDEPIEYVLTAFKEKIKIKYITCRPPSLPKQRNAGIANISLGTDWVGFLDDDLVLLEDTLWKLEECIQKESNLNLKGIGMSILNQPVPFSGLYNKLFLIGHTKPGTITSAGFPANIPTAQESFKTDWLYGGATFWSADVFERFSYDEWFRGTGYMEDIDFSFSVSREFELMISHESQCYHYHHPIKRDKQLDIGEWQFTSWWYFISKYNEFSLFYVFWGMLGVFIKNLGLGLCKVSMDNLLRSVGHIQGFFKILTGQALKSKGFSK